MSKITDFQPSHNYRNTGPRLTPPGSVRPIGLSGPVFPYHPERGWGGPARPPLALSPCLPAGTNRGGRAAVCRDLGWAPGGVR